MSISNTNRKAGPFDGNGTASSFPFYFKVFEATDLLVVLLNIATNVETELQITANYTVSLNANQDATPGGTVTLVSGALASGYKLTITSNIGNLQPTNLTNQGGFYPDVVEDALDRATIQIQQNAVTLDRSIKVPLSSNVNTELPNPEDNTLLGWDANGNITNYDPASLASVVAYATAYADTFNGDGTTTSWVLTRSPGTLYNLDVSINGVTQVPVTDYTLSGTTFTTTTAAPLNAVILVKYKEGLPNYSGDSQDIRYLPSGTGAVVTTVQAKLREWVSILDFGGSANGTTSNTTAITNLASAGFKRIHFPATGSNTYLFDATLSSGATSGMEWDVDDGVVISVLDTGYLSPNLKVVRPTKVIISALNRNYWLTPARNKSFAMEAAYSHQMAFSDADFSSVIPIYPNSSDLTYKYIAWPGSDTFAGFTPAATSVSGVQMSLTNTGTYYLGMRSLKPAEEMTTRFDSVTGTSMFVVALVRTTAGIHGAYSPIGAAAAPDFFEKLKGQTATSYTIGLPGLTTHQSYDGQYPLWSIRVNTPTNFSILVNGMEIVAYETPGEILECGFGGYASASGQVCLLQDWTLTKNKIQGGKQPLRIAIFGDSRTDANMPDTWPTWLRNYLDGWHGLRVHNITNYAIAGQVASQQAALCTPANIANSDVVIIDIGTNDIQVLTNEVTYFNTVKTMIQTCKTAGKYVVLGIPDTFYSQGQAGSGVGQATQNYGLGKYIRSKCLRLGAEMNVKVVDKMQCLGPIIAHYINSSLTPNLASLNIDPIVYDSIHFTAFGQQLIAGAYARAIAGMITRNAESSRIVAPTLLPTSASLSGVSITGTAGQFSCNAATLFVNQKLTISGTLGGTGSITGYSNPTSYYVIATNGSTTFTLSASLGGAAITTTAGTPTGLTYTLNIPQNNWTATLQPPKWFRDSAGNVNLTGLIEPGTKTNATVIYTLPENIWPLETARFVVMTDQNTYALLNIDSSTGQISIYSLNASATWLALDGVRFATRYNT